MGAAPLGGIGPVSVRYAAQIRELLYAQAVHRMAAEEEAARAARQAEKAERRAEPEEPVKIDVDVKKLEAPKEDAKPEPAPVVEPKAQFVDIQA